MTPSLVLLLHLGLAAPEAPPTPALLEVQVHEYFDGEMRESSLWAGLGVAGLGSGVAGLISRTDQGRGASVPFLGLGLLQLALGVGLFLRTPPQVERLDALLDHDPAAMALQESERMERVNAGFRVYRVVELSTLLAGAGVASFGRAVNSPAAVGFGLGLGAESVVMLALDLFADTRASLYADRLDAARAAFSTGP